MTVTPFSTPWVSQCRKYGGVIRGNGRNKMLTLHQESQLLLARENLARVRAQRARHS